MTSDTCVLDIESVLERVACRIEANVTGRAPVDTGAFNRKMHTGSIGVPIWLHDLMQEADVNHVRMIELGGRGVLTEAGWVSVEELRELAGD